MSGRAVNGYAVYCFYFFDGYHICKSVVSDGVRVLGLNVERNFFGQMCGDTRLVMVDVIVGQEHHVHASDNILNRNGEVYPRCFIHTEGRYQSAFVG